MPQHHTSSSSFLLLITIELGSAMKIRCDFCQSALASLICCADEAALCTPCDTLIHAANQLANMHQRVSLLAPSSQTPPPCDICQEKSAYFLCFEDRALLCRECDVSIHSANARVANHQRFLVTGVGVALHATNHQEPASEQVSLNNSSRNAAASNEKSALQSKRRSSKAAAKIKPSKRGVPLASVPPSVTVRSPASANHLDTSANRRHLVVPASTTPSGGSHFDSRCVHKKHHATEYSTKDIPCWDEFLTVVEGCNFGDASSSNVLLQPFDCL